MTWIFFSLFILQISFNNFFIIKINQWNMLSSTLSGRSVGHYIVFENEILSLGHEHQDAKEDEIWVYDPDCDSWTKYAKTPFHAIYEHRTFHASFHISLVQDYMK
jgi:N-acetylneuraminic acid mutarotase